MSQTSESEGEVRIRCYECFRPLPLCFCEAIPSIENRTSILMVQHVRERFHPFNTARIVQKALRKCHLITKSNQQLRSTDLPIQADAGLLYPHETAQELTDLPATERPSQLVIVDGTWHHAKTIVRDVPQLQKLPRYRLSPSLPGQYRIRREPDATSLSTLEATVAALQALEPATEGLNQLLSAFHRMVEGQLGYLTRHAVPRFKENQRSRPRYLPRTLLLNPDRLVIAYGEATPGAAGKRKAAPTPINWVAHRLGTTERFSCHIKQTQTLSDTATKHMRISAADTDTAITQEEFRRQWNQFLRHGDVVVVYHRRTFQLLQQIEASKPQCLVLKSIFGKWRSGFRSLEDLMEAEGLAIPIHQETITRAKYRLEMAVALVNHLRSHYGKLPLPDRTGTEGSLP